MFYIRDYLLNEWRKNESESHNNFNLKFKNERMFVLYQKNGKFRMCFRILPQEENLLLQQDNPFHLPCQE